MTGAILAGGRSRRMGFNKAFIRLAGPGGEEGPTIIEHAVEVFKEVFNEAMIIANDVPVYDGLGVKVFTDIHPGAGTLGGIFTALKLAEDAGEERVFVAACDMPWLDPRVIRVVVEHDAPGGFDAVVPRIGGRDHPMHALYHSTCIPFAEEMIRAGELKVSGLLERVRVKTLTEADFGGLAVARSVENVNTAEDLERVRSGPDGAKRKKGNR